MTFNLTSLEFAVSKIHRGPPFRYNYTFYIYVTVLLMAEQRFEASRVIYYTRFIPQRRRDFLRLIPQFLLLDAKTRRFRLNTQSALILKSTFKLTSQSRKPLDPSPVMGERRERRMHKTSFTALFVYYN